MKQTTKKILVIFVKWRHHANGLFGPSSNPGVDVICGLSLLLVLFLAPRGFSPGTLVFLSPPKPTFPNSNLTRNQVDEKPLCGCTTSKSSFIIYFIYLSCSNHWNECSLNNAEKRRLYKADFKDVRLLVCFFLQRITGVYFKYFAARLHGRSFHLPGLPPLPNMFPQVSLPLPSGLVTTLFCSVLFSLFLL